MAAASTAVSAGATLRWAAMPARRAMLYVVVLCLSVPVVLATLAGIELPLTALAIIVAAPLYFKVPGIPEKRLLTACGCLALLAVAGASVLEPRGGVARQLFSFAYFFSPYLTFFAGYALVRRQAEFLRVLVLMSTVFALVAILITASLVASGQSVRIERLGQMADYVGPGEALAGSLIGLPLYATWGVISLAVFYATMLAVICIRFRYLPPRTPLAALLEGSGLLCLFYLVVGSLSRTAAVGMAVFFWVFGRDVLSSRRAKPILAACAIPAALLLAAGMVIYGPRLAESNWLTLLRRNAESLQTASFNTFTSGRLTLVRAAFEDLAARPLTGSGFAGFREGVDRFNSSPHNQYLTALWKMGAPAACLYFVFLYRCVRNLARLKRRAGRPSVYHGFWALTLAYGLGFCLTWDVFLVPLTGAFLMFLLGIFARLARTESASGLPEADAVV